MQQKINMQGSLTSQVTSVSVVAVYFTTLFPLAKLQLLSFSPDPYHSCVGVDFFVTVHYTQTKREHTKTNQGFKHLIFVFTIYATHLYARTLCGDEETQLMS